MWCNYFKGMPSVPFSFCRIGTISLYINEGNWHSFQKTIMSLTYKKSAVLFLNKSFIPVESDKVSNNGPSKICGKQPLKKLNWYGLLRQSIPLQIFLKAVFHKFYLVHSLILCLEYSIIKLRGLFKTLSSI